MTKPILPAAALAQHIAVLGKTGSGKTTTAKLIVEREVAAGARVCILDPIKSDWWGLISSADGKKPGLPFHILGGPRGHVPLHASAGKAVAEVVASGALPLSIIDMADFPPGGHAQFFVDFAAVLLRKMRGVLYLVIEEAHEFAPKERSGIGAETMAIHYAKKLATAGRSKGIRLIVATQRTQALHNALLGSCDTLIAHRLTTPADKEPVIKWLKDNATKEAMTEVSGSLAGLKTGEGWIYSGEAKIFERRQFPRLTTYDNSATPTDDSTEHQVKAAPVDQEKLRAIIGEAVKEAEASDPKALRRRIAELEKQVAAKPAPAVDEGAIAAAELRGRDHELERIRVAIKGTNPIPAINAIRDAAMWVEDLITVVSSPHRELTPFREVAPAPRSTGSTAHKGAMAVKAERAAALRSPAGELANLGKAERLILTALAQYPAGRTKVQVAILTEYSHKGGSFNNSLGALRSKGWIAGGGENIKATEAGLIALGPFDPLPTGADLREHCMAREGKAARQILQALFDVYPDGLDKGALAAQAGYEASGGSFNNTLGRLRTLEYITRGTPITASADFFQ